MHSNLLLGALSFLSLALICASLEPGAVVSHKLSQSEADVLAYWTPERQRAAIPMTLERSSLSLSSVEPVGPNGPPGFTKGYQGDLNQEAQANYSSLLGASPVVNPTTYPQSVIGKVFFTQSGLNYVCSGSAISSNTVLTAAQCVYGGGNWDTNFAFYPSYSPSGSGTGYGATRVWSASGWVTNASYTYDYAAATFGTVAHFNSLGWIGTTWNAAVTSSTTFESLGYPAVSPYPGSVKYQAIGNAVVPQVSPYTYAGTVEMGNNDMTGGCAGGPWWNLQVNSGIGGTYANGVSSFRYTALPSNLWSPYFDTAFGTWVNNVIANQLT